MLFDTFHAPSICFATPAPLALYASGRTTGVVVECGSSLTSVTPVFDGLPLSHAVNIMEFGGQDITAQIRKQLSDKNIFIESFDAKLVKEKLGQVMPTNVIDKSKENIINKYELPDGTEIEIDNKTIISSTEALCCNNKFVPNGLVAQLSDSLNLCDDSVFKELADNIILSGGGSMLNGSNLNTRTHTHLNTVIISFFFNYYFQG